MRRSRLALSLLLLSVCALIFTLAPTTVYAQSTTLDSWNFDSFTPTNWQGWSTDNGLWQLGAPKNPNGPSAYNGATQCMSTGLTADYPALTSSRLISPAITLPAISAGESLMLNFFEWFQLLNSYGQTSGDIQVSVWNGKAWGSWQTVSNRNVEDGPSQWSLGGVDLSAFAGESIRFAFQQTDGNNNGAGWFLDDVSVVAQTDMSPSQLTDFENFTPTNWQGWYSDNGMWQVGTPPKTSGPGAAFSGSTQCAGTGMTNGSYPALTDSRLISPAVTLPGVSAGESLELQFFQWFDLVNSYGATVSDVEISVWNGSAWGAWTTISEHTIENGTSPWSLCQCDLYSYAGDRVRFAFHISSGNNNGPGWYLDNIGIALVPDASPNTTAVFGGFVTSTNWGGWWADNGVWQIGAPTNKSGPSAPFDGDTETASTGLNADYSANTDSRLISPPLTLPSVVSGQFLTLGFAQWFQLTNSYGETTGDVEISTWDGTAWSAWTTISSTISGTSPWSLSSYDITAYAGDRARVAFHESSGNNNGAGWDLDFVSVQLPAPINLALTHTRGGFLSSVGITGEYLDGATNVSFNGTSASFTVVSDSLINAIVPVGATAGPVTVTTPTGKAVGPVFTPISQTPEPLISPSTCSFVGSLSVSISDSLAESTILYTTDGSDPATSTTAKTYTSPFTIDATTPVIAVDEATGCTNNPEDSALFTKVASAALLTATASPTAVTGGSTSIGTVTVSALSQTPTTIDLSSTAGASVPASVLIPAGSTSASFTIQTDPVAANTKATIQATLGKASRSLTLTIKAPALSAASFVPASVTGSNNASLTIALSGVAAADVVVSLSSSNPLVTPPATATIPEGQQSVTVPIPTGAVATKTPVSIKVTLGSATLTPSVTLLPATVASLSLSPTSVIGIYSVSGTVSLTGIASADTPIAVTSTNGVATIPSPVIVPAGQSSVTFPINTSKVSAKTLATIKASLGTVTKSAALTVLP
jgi:hypothetical protein